MDCVYACGNDYVAPAADVVKSRGLEGCKIYGADISPNICQLIMEGKSERDCGKEMGLSRNTFVYRRDKLFQKLRSELKDYI